MSRRPRQVGITAVLALAIGLPAHASGPTLAVRDRGAWRTWWRADSAAAQWPGSDPRVTGALAWRAVADGVRWCEIRIAGSAPAWRTRLIVVRIDPRRVRLALALALSPGDGRPAWSIDRAPRDALVAVNAGQFVQTMPWGWVVMEGRQRLSPGTGPLSVAVVVDSSGAVRWVPSDSLAGTRGVATAFQSYPTLLADDGRIPAALREPGHGIDLAHRDTRLAIGETRDGHLLVVMTRFDALGAAADRVPIGPTTPEMAAIMGALGARDAVMLDGGISAQMVIRDRGGAVRARWPGLRKVPLALLVRPREP